MRATTMKAFSACGVTLVVLAAVGCSAPTGSPESTATSESQAMAVRWGESAGAWTELGSTTVGGVWNAALGYCGSPSPEYLEVKTAANTTYELFEVAVSAHATAAGKAIFFPVKSFVTTGY